MENQFIIDNLKTKFGENAIVHFGVEYDILNIEINHSIIHDVLYFAKTSEALNFNFLTDLCGVHYPQNADKALGVIYHLHNFIANKRIRIKTFFSIQQAEIPTATDIWPSANWMERETYDFFGIVFKGHNDLRRILNVDEMDYFPMRKEYPLEDNTRTDKVDTFFGRDGNTVQTFDKRYQNKLH